MDRDWLHEAWEYREETLFPAILRRSAAAGISTLNEEVFTERFGQPGVDPRWLHCGVMMFPPAEGVHTCGLITSGLSNAWNAIAPVANAPSGLGFELHFELQECSAWARTVLLRVMAHQLLVHADLIGGERIFAGALLPLGGPIAKGSELTHLLAVRSPYATEPFELVTGTFELLLLLGVSDGEAKFAHRNSSAGLIERWEEQGIEWVRTDPSRRSVV